jgi:L-amino acid N-acyltransferase YncA
MGTGTQLTNALIEIARKRSFEILEPSVFSSNKQAHHVYKKCGFKDVGKIKREVKMPDGKYTDNIILTLSLK